MRPPLPHVIARQSPVIGMEDGEFSDVLLFRERAEKLHKSQQKYQGFPMAGVTRHEPSGQMIFSANTPDAHEVENLAALCVG